MRGDWNRRLRSTTLFLQSGLVAQTWFGIGNPAYPNGAPAAGSNTAYDASNLMLFGFRSTIGINF